MSRRALAWLSAFPLLVLGTLAAHGAAYRLVEPDTQERAAILARSGHAYLDQAAFVLAAAAALLSAALAARFVNGLRHRRSAATPGWALAIVPPLAFVLQEHLEHILSGTGFSPGLAPVFLVGLALQLPFGFAALLVARALGDAAEALGRALASAEPPRVARRPAAVTVPARLSLPRSWPAGRGSSQRGPPS
jgi:hypothetical protein